MASSNGLYDDDDDDDNNNNNNSLSFNETSNYSHL